MAENVKDSSFNKREYPRVQVSCPVKYQVDSQNEWQDAVLHDYSATGANMICDDLILSGEKLTIRLLPDSLQKVPAISADSIVVRCDLDDEHRFRISCEFLKVLRFNS